MSMDVSYTAPGMKDEKTIWDKEKSAKLGCLSNCQKEMILLFKINVHVLKFPDSISAMYHP